MNSLRLVVGFLFLILCVGDATPETKDEALDFKLGPEWLAAHHANANGYTILEFVRQGDDINSWKELVTIQKFVGSSKSPEETLNHLKKLREKECPGATEWNVIEKNENSILYEWQVKPCRGWPEQHEIARIIRGKHDLYFLHYAAKVHEIAPETREQWIKTLSSATITINSKADPLDPLSESKDVDEVVPFVIEKVIAALKPAMESEGCNIAEETANRIECKRARRFSGAAPSSGGESVTAILEATGEQTRVRISTGKGFYGRLGKTNWSMPIYQKMMNGLQAQQKPKEATSQVAGASEVTSGNLQDQTPIAFSNWGYNPAPGAHLELVEIERKNVKRGTQVTYRFETFGFPAGKTYMLWIMQSGDHKAYPIQGPYSVDATGKLVCREQTQPAHSRCFALENVRTFVDGYHKGEPADYLVVSTDGMVRAYARAFSRSRPRTENALCTSSSKTPNSLRLSFGEPGSNQARR
jgi:hypothetical protein